MAHRNTTTSTSSPASN